MKNSKVVLIFIILAILASGCTVWKEDEEMSNKIVVVGSDSYFDDFEVVEHIVKIKCDVLLKNNSSKSKTVKLMAIFSDDVKGGLLQKAELTGENSDGTNEFIVPAKSQEWFDVVFIGDFAGTYKKQDRLLPEIYVELID